MTAPTGNDELLLEERRELTLRGRALLEALLEFDRVHNGWLWRATEHKLQINTEGSPPVVVEAKRSDGDASARAEFSIGHVAATFIHLCRQLHIPMPRSARKEVKIAADGATLILHLTAPLPLHHSHSAPAPAGAKPKAPRPAATEPAAEGAATGEGAAEVPTDGAANGAAGEPAGDAAVAEASADSAAAEPTPADAEAPAPAAAAG